VAETLIYVTQVASYRQGPAGVHGVLPQSAIAMAELAERHGLRGRAVDDVRELDVDDLRAARAVALFTIGETPWSQAQKAALLEGLHEGATCVVAVHAATDSCYGWDEYVRLTGARFDGHPWTQEFTLDVVEPDHPAVRNLGDSWRWHDEVYQFRDLRPDARILLRVRDGELDPNAAGARRPPWGYPLSWCFTEGRGRVFSTTLGHFPAAWESPLYLQHVDGGLAWALGHAG
jgi:uncharacterized protein